MSDTTPAPSTAPAPAAGAAPAPAGGSGTAATTTADNDHRYQAVQHKLKTLAKAMDDATGRLELLKARMKANGARTTQLAADIDQAELDALFVELTNSVATALGSAAVQVSRLHTSAQEVTNLAEETRVKHNRFYEALDRVRSGRRIRTPKPGFFRR